MTRGAKQRSQLSSGALDALKEFYGERDARQKQFEDLKAQAEDDFEGKLSMEAFTEDWNASQFWVRDSILLVRMNIALTITCTVQRRNSHDTRPPFTRGRHR